MASVPVIARTAEGGNQEKTQPEIKRTEKDITVYMIQPNGVQVEMPEDLKNQVVQWVIDLSDEKTRETALLELSKKRETIPELAVWLWHAFGTMAALLQETVNTYIYMDPPTLTAHQSNRVCNALALLQCVASHKETRKLFLEARIPLFLYPFLANRQTTRPFEYLRLTSLGVIGALVKTDDPDVIQYLLNGENSEIIPLCLKIMDSGSELSKTVATFIVQKILWDERGLNYICQTFPRFTHVASVLKIMVDNLEVPSAENNTTKKGQTPNPATATGRLLKHILRCYIRFSEHPRAKDPLKEPKLFPQKLTDSSLLPLFREDKSSVIWLAQICNNLGITSEIVNQLGGTVGTGAITSPEQQQQMNFMLGNVGQAGQPFGSRGELSMPVGGGGVHGVTGAALNPTAISGNAGNATGNMTGMRTSPNLMQMPSAAVSGNALGFQGMTMTSSSGGAGGQSQISRLAGAGGMQMFGPAPGGAGAQQPGNTGGAGGLHGMGGPHNNMGMGQSIFGGGFMPMPNGGQNGAGNNNTPNLPPHMQRHGGM